MKPKTRDDYINQCKSHYEIFDKHNKVLISYVRDKSGNRRGTIIGFEINKTPYIGWSLCKTTHDKFNKYIGLSEALKRAAPIEFPQEKYNWLQQKAWYDKFKDMSNVNPVPHSIWRYVETMFYRTQAYFRLKGEAVSTTIN